MDEALKKRLIGAAVLVSLAVIFVPMLLEEETVIDTGIHTTNIPEKPAVTVNQKPLTIEQVEQKRESVDFGNSIKPQKDTEVREINEKTAETESTSGKQVPVTTRVGLTSWMVQVGSFSNQDNARKIVDKLRKAGYDTHLETAQVKSSTVYRVRVGPEIDHNLAEKNARDISKKFFVNAKVIRYP